MMANQKTPKITGKASPVPHSGQRRGGSGGGGGGAGVSQSIVKPTVQILKSAVPKKGK